MSVFLWISVIGVALLIPTAYAGLIGAPYVPTRRKAIEEAFSQLPLSADDLLVDLGAGDGVVLKLAAARGAQACGYELSPIMWAAAKLRLWFSRPLRASVRYGNFYRAQLPAETTVIFAFLIPDNLPRLLEFLKKQHLPRGRFLLSYIFPLPGVPPLRVIRANRAGHVYVYDLSSLIASP